MLERYRDIGAQIPIVQELSAPNNKRPGAFVIPFIRTGDLIPLGPSHAIEADFDAIEILGAVPILFEKYKKSFSAKVDNSPLLFRHGFYGSDSTDQQIFRAGLFAGAIATSFFKLQLASIDDSRKRNAARNFLGWVPLNTDQSKNPVMTRRLSESSDLGMCSEVAILAKEVMSRVGVDIDYATGYVSDFKDRLDAEYHSFLTTQNGRIIIDPVEMISDLSSSGPTGLNVASEGRTYLDLPEGEGAYYWGLSCRQQYYSPVALSFN